MIIQIIYDYKSNDTMPLYGILYDGNNVKFLPLYLKGIGTRLDQVFDNLNIIKELLLSGDVIINDVISLLRHININPMSDTYKIYENSRAGLSQSTEEKDVRDQLKHMLIQASKTPKQPWMLAKGNASVVYSYLERRGVMCGPHLYHPTIDTKTFTGRSRSAKFNIQGATAEDPIKHTDPNNNIFVCFDWMAADIRMSGYLSGDEFINNSFIESDPYTKLSELLDGEFSRDECKLEMLSSIYALNPNAPIMSMFPQLREWLNNSMKSYIDDKPLHTILGMPIPHGAMKSVVNATVQGSVAECMQSVLHKIRNISSYIMMEIHDSLVIACDQKSVNMVIRTIGKFMKDPLGDIVDNGPIFPVRVSIGKKWKQWIKLKTV